MLFFLLTLVFIYEKNIFIVLRRLQEPRQVGGGRGWGLANQKAGDAFTVPLHNTTRIYALVYNQLIHLDVCWHLK